MTSKGKETASFVLLGLGLVGAVVELFYRPLGIALPALIATLVGSTISNKYHRMGLVTVAAITVCFLIGASIAVWYSRALY